MTFREHESYYGLTSDTGIALSPPEVQQEGEGDNEGSPLSPILVATSDVLPTLDNVQNQGEDPNSDGCNHGSGHGYIQDATGNSSLPSQDGELHRHEDPGTNNNPSSPVAPISTTRQSDNQLSILAPEMTCLLL